MSSSSSPPPDVIGYFAFWTCVFVLQFLNYLNSYRGGVGFSNVS